MARRLFESTPILEGAVAGRRAAQRIGGAALLGASLGSLLLSILVFVLVPLEPALAARLRSRAAAPAWFPLALATEASILEEIVFRLFLFTFVVWLCSRAWRATLPAPRSRCVWSANVISALAFAAVHLPAWLGTLKPSGPLIGSVLLLNGVAGLALGYIYWRWGIESAITAHFAADLVVQSLGPRLV